MEDVDAKAFHVNFYYKGDRIHHIMLYHIVFYIINSFLL